VFSILSEAIFFILVYVIKNKGCFVDISPRIYQHQKIFNLTPKLTEQSINEQIDSAFKIWAKQSKLKFKKMKPNKPCNIKICFCQKIHNKGFDFDEKGGTLAHGFYPGENLGGDLHFDSSENWTEKPALPPQATINKLSSSMK